MLAVLRQERRFVQQKIDEVTRLQELVKRSGGSAPQRVTDSRKLFEAENRSFDSGVLFSQIGDDFG